MWLTKKRLERDVARWREAGWVTAEGETAIRAEIAGSGRGVGLASVLAILGVVLLGFAVMSFVAANWEAFPRLARLFLIFGMLWAAFLGAAALFERRLTGFAHALVLLGVSVFGAGIMLIAQMFHIEGNPPDAVLTWAAGAALAGIALNSNPSLAAAMLLVGLWSGWETTQTSAVHWPFLLAWGALAAAFYWRGWRPGLHLSCAAVAVWLVALGYLLYDGHAHTLVVLLGLSGTGAALASEYVAPRFESGAAAVAGYAMVVAFSGLFALQFIESSPLDALIFWAVLTLASLVGAVFWGLRQGQRGIVWLAYAGFSVEILSLYFKTVGTLLGSSLFFFVMGLIVIALAALAWRLHARAAMPPGVRP